MKAILLSLLSLGFVFAGQQKNSDLYEPHIDHSRHWNQRGFL